ncbi:MAG: MinD/ParA family protein [Candidatus Micrarchaeales archaeon]|jgi:MinD-like ATPase involved in chromosome partitioning or flagellar assembly
MDKKPYIIMIASQKGGVGKTTIALNLAVALRYKNLNVLLVDTDLESASASEQLGIRIDGRGYFDVVNGDAEVREAIFAYEPIDLHIIPGSPAKELNKIEPRDLDRFYAKLSKLEYDFIIIDSPPGLFPEIIAKYLNDVAILTTPDSISSVGSSRMAMYCEKYKIEHRLIINRMGYSKFDLEREEVEQLFGDVSFQTVPEDKIIPESVLKHKPAYLIDKNAYFCLAIDEIARDYTLKLSGPAENRGPGLEPDRSMEPSAFEKLARWFFRSR